MKRGGSEGRHWNKHVKVQMCFWLHQMYQISTFQLMCAQWNIIFVQAGILFEQTGTEAEGHDNKQTRTWRCWDARQLFPP